MPKLLHRMSSKPSGGTCADRASTGLRNDSSLDRGKRGRPRIRIAVRRDHSEGRRSYDLRHLKGVLWPIDLGIETNTLYGCSLSSQHFSVELPRSRLRLQREALEACDGW